MTLKSRNVLLSTLSADVLSPSTVAATDDARWKALTARANAAFAEDRWEEAERLYLEALAEAEALFRSFGEGGPVGSAEPAPMLVVATANLAECWLRVGQHARAGDQVVALSRRLCDVLENEQVPLGVREQCLIHLRPAVFELVDKLGRAGWSEAATARELERAKAVALRFLAQHTPKN